MSLFLAGARNYYVHKCHRDVVKRAQEQRAPRVNKR